VFILKPLNEPHYCKLIFIEFLTKTLFSGVLVEYDLTQSPGNRVTSLFLRCGHCSVPKFEPLVLTANYTIVMTDYLANGGNNYQAFQKRINNELLGL